ncbi:MMPL family transporter [Jidongwangia harbinensis]|uniref:MMPL family transporter n=1 Tax=Jidongwangia harbinensis TaxID=2878561 RepID=UPI001CD9C403|nr:MMPL family transporter [Jidongwangia harbinensis]MCA2216388.1 MMPL family transporter [Jidongwangia harbinensis]
MFAAWGSWVARFRWPVFTVALAAVIGAGVWGTGVFGQLSEGGYHDPGSESTRAAEVVRQGLGAQGGDVVVVYTPTTGGIDDAALADRVRDRLDRLPRDAVSATTSYWSADRAPRYASADRRSAVAVLTLAGADDSAKLASYRQIDDRLAVPGARVQVAGGTVLGDASARLSTRDLAVAEAVSLPIVLILLLLVFGSLVAAALPVLVGGAAVLGSLGVLHAVALTHNVNSFAVNVASLLGLGMAIDYGLFMVGRFREEQEYGRTPAEAVTRTVATAGRTVLFSATLLMIALAGLLLFPQGFLKSLAYGGLAAVALAAVLSLSLLPALLAILGRRVDKLPIRLPRRRTARPPGSGWARLADVVLRRPVLVAVPLVLGLLVLAAPIRGVHFGETDERVLPAGEPARQAIETLKADFPALSSVGIQVVLRGTRGEAPEPAATATFADRLRQVRGVAAVTPAGSGDVVVVFTATTEATDPFAGAARDAVTDIRALRPPADTELLVGGTTARSVDSLEATADRLPLMIGLLVGATLILMSLAFGSILLPVKAVVVSALSLTATFGILVWIFSDGHGAGLLRVTPAPLEVGIVVLMAAVVFGLSTDYEVFLLSRMVEARTRGATTAEAVTTGLARTGRVISAAALLLIVVTGAFALSSVTTMRFVGVGMIIALVLDATVVRMLLVPALLRMLGAAAWWAPGPLRRLQERAGLAEYADEELFPTVSVGRHAAPEDADPRPAAPGPAPGHAEPVSDRDRSAIRVGTGDRSASPRTERPSVRFLTGDENTPDPAATVVLDGPTTVDLSARRAPEHPDHG